MTPDQIINNLKAIKKQYPYSKVFSAGIYDIEYFNEGQEPDEQLDVDTWNEVVQQANDLVNWEAISQEISEALNNSYANITKERERDKELWQ